jgi:hypothetical protein
MALSEIVCAECCMLCEGIDPFLKNTKKVKLRTSTVLNSLSTYFGYFQENLKERDDLGYVDIEERIPEWVLRETECK